MIQRTATLSACLLTLFTLHATGANPASQVPADTTPAPRPNILLIIADDCTYNDLPVNGGVNAKTPHLDRLASEGLVFERAYLAEAMCQPSRSELYTGLYPVSNGCAWNHSASLNHVRSMPQVLGDAGYRVGLAGKVHVKPRSVFPFQKVAGFDPSCVRNPTQPHTLDGSRDFLTRNPDQPFCLVVALTEPHVPWVMGDTSRYPRKQLTLPPTLADTPETRDAFAHYLAEITYMDGQVGDLLGLLEETGHAKDTLVLFTSEQGSQFPGNKWTCWDTGLHTSLIARWPGIVPAGKRSSAIVQYADILPTLVHLSGGREPKGAFDGSSFLPVLRGQTDSHRTWAYGMHNNAPEGPPYPIRTITDGSYRYIRNLRPEELYIEKHLMGKIRREQLGDPYWVSWARQSETPRTYSLMRRFMRRPAEELYHTATDPYEMTNLAQDAHYAEIKSRLSRELDAWMKTEQDPGAPLDTVEALEAARKGKHLYPAR